MFVLGVMPSRRVLNHLLGLGEQDAGMSGGCRWEPFEVDEQEWQEIREALEERDVFFVEPPDWVENLHDWHAWLFDLRYGIPAEEHRRLMQEDADLGRAIARAAAAGDQETVAELHLERVRVGAELAEMVAQYVLGTRTRSPVL
jgi:hypothetical protein